jgi:hypothetical protein
LKFSRVEKTQRQLQDQHYAAQFEEFAKQIELQRKTFEIQSKNQTKTLRGGGGKRKPIQQSISTDSPKKSGWFGFFRNSPKPEQ